MDRNAKVLIVDDDENIRNTMKAILEDEGYIVDLAATGSEAVEKTQKVAYNIALLDIQVTRYGGHRIIETNEGRDSKNTKNNGNRISVNAKCNHSPKQKRRRIPNQTRKRRKTTRHSKRTTKTTTRRKTI